MSRTQLSDFAFTFHFHALEKEMASHSSVLAWRIPGTGEPGGLLSMGLHRVGHDWSDLAAAAAVLALEKGMATYSSILAWRISWTEELEGLQFMGLKKVSNMTEWLTLVAQRQRICLQWRRLRQCRCGFNPWVGKMPWRRKWQPLQYSFLGNPMDRKVWKATVHGVEKNLTRLKWLNIA